MHSVRPVDAGSPDRLGAFWAAVLGRTWEAHDNGDGLLTGPTPQHTIWVNRVPEAKTVKHRVHLISTPAIWRTWRRSARPSSSQHGTRGWTLMADPRETSSARSLGDDARQPLGRPLGRLSALAVLPPVSAGRMSRKLGERTRDR